MTGKVAALAGRPGSALEAGEPGADGRSRRALMLATAATVALNVSTLVVNFVLALVLAHALGTAGYGAYAYAFAWATFLSVPASLGLTPLVIRHVSQYEVQGRWELMRGVLRRAHQVVAVSSVLLVAGAGGVGWLLLGDNSQLFAPFLVGLLLVPLMSLTGVRQAALQGLNRVIIGRVPETLVLPGLFLVLVLLLWAARGDRFTAEWAVALNVAAALVAFLIGVVLLRSALPNEVRGVEPGYEGGAWVRSGLPLLALGLMLVINSQVGTILLGSIEGAESAGTFNVAMRVAAFTSFLFLAASYPLYPVVARLWAAQETEPLQRLMTRTGRVVLLVSAVVAVVFAIFARQLLGLFGGEFDAGVTALRILVVGELLKVACGFGGLALVMSPFERTMMAGTAVGVAVNVPLTAALIPFWGVEGAAVGSTASAALSSVVIAWLAWRRLGIYAPGLGRARSRAE